MVKEVINPLEDDPLEAAPLIDNVKPISAFFWYMLSLPRLRVPHVRRFVVRGLLLLARTNALPRSYGLHLPPVADAEISGATARRRSQRVVAFARLLARRLLREPQDTALAQIQQEAKRQLRREIREFEDAMVNAIARIAASPEHSETALFVCGHTHSAQVVALNEQQTFVNTGTWTTIVLDIATNRREEQRFPFLEIHYQEDSPLPYGKLMVWQGTGTVAQAWLRPGEPSAARPNKAQPGSAGATATQPPIDR
jgi:hypothetical protein